MKNAKFSALALCFGLALTASACGPDENPSTNNSAQTCAAGEVEIPSDVNDADGNVALAAGCYAGCSTNVDCGSGQRCRMTSLGGVCIVDDTTNNTTTNNTTTNNTTANNTTANNTTANNTTANNTTPNNTTPNNTTPNNTTPNNTTPNNTTPNNTTPNNTTPMDDCGNGMVDAGEACDGDCPTSDLDCDDFDACTINRVKAGTSAAMCTAVCESEPISTCVDDDGCCAAGCNANNDNDCGMQMMDDTGTACAADADCGANGICIQAQMDGTWSGGYCTNACFAPADCGGDSECLAVDMQGNAFCFDGCLSNNDCRMGYECVDVGGPSVCIPEEPQVAGMTGAACTADADCDAAEGCLLPADGWAGGYCTRGCTTDSECPTSSHCEITDPNAGQGLCVSDCTTDADCRMGYGCGDPDGNGATGCFPVASGNGVPGDACATLQDCSGGADGFCVSEDQGFTGGYCSIQCTTDADCGAGGHCSTLDSGFQLCVDSCTTNADCRAGYVCDDANGDNVNECWPGGSGAGGPGNACANVGDCAGGLDAICLGPPGNPDFAGGYCATTGCTTNADCAAGAHCGFTDPQTGEGFCLPGCTADADCRTGYACADPDGDATSECFPTASGNGVTGVSCTAIQDCDGGADGICIAEQEDGTWSGGYCTIDCTSDADCTGDGTCVLVDPQAGTNICLDACNSTADCRTGYGCADVDGDLTNECIPQ